MELYQVLLIVFSVIVAGLYFFKKFSGIDILKNIVLSRPVLAAQEKACEAVYNIWPERKEQKIVTVVMKAAINGAEIAEKAWKMGNLTKEERNPYAKALVKETLANAGIEITPQIAMIVDGVIEAVCFVLPHASKEEKKEHTPATPVIRGD